VLIGVVHLVATPGAARFGGDAGAVIERAVQDARALAAGGCDALLVENFGDVPFFRARVPPETVAAMAVCVRAVMAACGPIPVGINVLRNDARSALGICAATGGGFVRINVHTGAAVSDQGILRGKAAETLRERSRLCPAVKLLCDVHVKHATPLGKSDITQASADTVRRGLADALIVTGTATGDAPHRQEVKRVLEGAAGTPVLVGSGVTEANAAELVAGTAGAIVGTFFERDGRSGNPVDPLRVARLRAAFDAIG
jgi:hypothetical protein